MVKPSTGGFQAFALRKPLLKGVLKKGYKVPTPIQRKAVPAIIDGKDVIAMSRTGSGKTLAYVLPCFERLFQLEGKQIAFLKSSLIEFDFLQAKPESKR